METNISELFEGILQETDGDIQPLAVDFDGDGIVDEIIFGVDADHDGSVDYFIQEVDIDQDGISDGYMTITDLSDAGHPGYTQIQTFVDLDGDMQPDIIASAAVDYIGNAGGIAFYGDPDGDHIWEAQETYLFENESVFLIPDGESAPSDCYVPFDPSTADMSRVIGNPEAYMDNWHLQETGFSCSVAAQEFMMEEMLGISVEEAELRRIAVENGWLTNAGTCRSDVGRLLDYMGLDVQVSVGNSFEDLCNCLSRGIHPVVSVDSDELWSGKDEEMYMPGWDSNHSIQVIGVDIQDPENPMVIINDSGVTNGCGAMVPADLFMGAWMDSDCFMVEAYV